MSYKDLANALVLEERSCGKCGATCYAPYLWCQRCVGEWAAKHTAWEDEQARKAACAARPFGGPPLHAPDPPR